MNSIPAIGTAVDLLKLRDLRRELHINVYLYLDADLARTSDLIADLKKYRMVDPDLRPVLEIEEFLKNMQKQIKQIVGPSTNAEQMLQEEPLYATILATGEMPTAVGPRGYIKALMPYLDEMEEIQYSNATAVRENTNP